MNYLGILIGFIIAALILYFFDSTIELPAIIAIAIGLIVGEVIRRIRVKNKDT
ncbi:MULTISPECIES: hypothetical protein [Robertmurraya]|uniref:Uncharacterized protein n=1 Tax=Robertmurraya beringensis TaxID=641660 RepID=A0ABV6KUG5_9BACI